MGWSPFDDNILRLYRKFAGPRSHNYSGRLSRRSLEKDQWVLDGPWVCTHYSKKSEYCEAYGWMITENWPESLAAVQLNGISLQAKWGMLSSQNRQMLQILFGPSAAFSVLGFHLRFHHTIACSQWSLSMPPHH